MVRGCVVVLLTTTLAHAAVPPNHRNFVACPIVRDTATVPCWLAEYEGQLYFLTLQTDVSAPVNPPWLGHRVLVEGVVSEEPNICGGKVLKPVVLSVLPELDATCNTILPAEERYNLTFEPPRPPGPSGGRLAFGNPAPRGSTVATPGPRTITLQYGFDGTVVFRHAQALQQILEAAQRSKAVRVEVVGYRAAVLLSNGTTMTEKAGIGRGTCGAGRSAAERCRSHERRVPGQFAGRATSGRNRRRRVSPRRSDRKVGDRGSGSGIRDQG